MTDERYAALSERWDSFFGEDGYTYEDMANWAENYVPDLFAEIDRLREIEARMKGLEK